MTSTSLIGSILSWLSAGYPEGIPATDRFPLVALLRRTLTDDQVLEVVQKLREDSDNGPVDTGDIQHYISDVTRDEPTVQDIKRVSSRLAAGGWPLAGVHPADAQA